MSTLRTRPPETPVVLYDGQCRFCSGAAKRLATLAGPDLRLVSFQEPGVLDAFPGLDWERCMRAMQLVDTDGRVFEGVEAIVAALQDRWFGPLLKAYYAPGLRQLADAGYRVIARLRYRIAGRSACDGDACEVHFR